MTPIMDGSRVLALGGIPCSGLCGEQASPPKLQSCVPASGTKLTSKLSGGSGQPGSLPSKVARRELSRYDRPCALKIIGVYAPPDNEVHERHQFV